MIFETDHGFHVFDTHEHVENWAAAAYVEALKITADPEMRAANLRHGGSWFVGVDALPNLPDGSLNGIALDGPWCDHIDLPEAWHRAQLSVMYPGYPARDEADTEAQHRFRQIRFAAHVDGLLPEGPARRRFLRECHGFILGLPLNQTDAAPLMVWPGSHHIMGPALHKAVAGRDPVSVDLTDAYQDARRRVFESCEAVPVRAAPGQTILLHRHLLHGVAAFGPSQTAPPEGRMIAYLRPEMSAGPAAWLAPDQKAS